MQMNNAYQQQQPTTAVLSSQLRCVALKVYIGKAAFWRSSSSCNGLQPLVVFVCTMSHSDAFSPLANSPSPLQPAPHYSLLSHPAPPCLFRVSYFTTSSNSSTTRTALLLCNGNSFGAFFAEKPAKKFVKRWWKMDTSYESKTLIFNLGLQLEFNFIYDYSLELCSTIQSTVKRILTLVA